MSGIRKGIRRDDFLHGARNREREVVSSRIDQLVEGVRFADTVKMRWVLIVVTFTFGCVKSRLVPCGDLECPVGFACLADRCIDPRQLDACVNFADGQPCVVANADGRCLDGVCEVIRCGNGVIEPGEVCDDSNRANGDGCRGDCLSDEVCGNGLVDPGESCDCGASEGSRPVGCAMLNDEAPDALCDTHCSRRCGDGVVTGAESCDGVAIPIGCGDLGYYNGQLTCTGFCTLDKAGCIGRCGDGTLQLAAGEECDGAPPNGTCVGFGRDYGELGCSAICSPDVPNDCHHYEWEEVFSLGSTAFSSANLNRHGMMAIEPGNVHVQFGGIVDQRARGDLSIVVATADAFVALGPTRTLRYSATGWTDLPALGAVVGASADGSSVYTVDASCALQRLDVDAGTVVSVAASPLTSCTGIDVRGGKIALAASDLIAWFDGASWQVRTGLALAGTVGWRDATHIYYAGKVGTPKRMSLIDTATAGAPVDFEVGSGPKFAVSTGGAEIDEGFDTDGAPATRSVVDGQRVYIFPPPTFVNGLGRAGDGGIVAWGTGVYRSRAQWVQPLYGATDFVGPQRDGSLVYCKYQTVGQVGIATGSIERAFPSGGTCTSVVGSVFGVHYVGAANGVYRADSPFTGYVQEITSGGRVLADSAGQLWALAGGIRRREAGVWVPITAPPNCVLLDVATQGTEFYLLGRCGLLADITLYRYNGSGWDTVAAAGAGGPDRLAIAADGTIFGGTSSSLWRLDGTTWTFVLSSSMTALAARSHDEVYYGYGGTLNKWNGVREVPIRLPGTVNLQRIAVAPSALYVSGGVQTFFLTSWSETRPPGI